MLLARLIAFVHRYPDDNAPARTLDDLLRLIHPSDTFSIAWDRLRRGNMAGAHAGLNHVSSRCVLLSDVPITCTPFADLADIQKHCLGAECVVRPILYEFNGQTNWLLGVYHGWEQTLIIICKNDVPRRIREQNFMEMSLLVTDPEAEEPVSLLEQIGQNFEALSDTALVCAFILAVVKEQCNDVRSISDAHALGLLKKFNLKRTICWDRAQMQKWLREIFEMEAGSDDELALLESSSDMEEAAAAVEEYEEEEEEEADPITNKRGREDEEALPEPASEKPRKVDHVSNNSEINHVQEAEVDEELEENEHMVQDGAQLVPGQHMALELPAKSYHGRADRYKKCILLESLSQESECLSTAWIVVGISSAVPPQQELLLVEKEYLKSLPPDAEEHMHVPLEVTMEAWDGEEKYVTPFELRDLGPGAYYLAQPLKLVKWKNENYALCRLSLGKTWDNAWNSKARFDDFDILARQQLTHVTEGSVALAVGSCAWMSGPDRWQRVTTASVPEGPRSRSKVSVNVPGGGVREAVPVSDLLIEK